MNSARTDLLDRLVFNTAAGEVLDQDRRYLLMRADVLMGLFALLPPASRGLAIDALSESVFQHGADSVRAYARAPGSTPEKLLITMQDSAASLGWGRWHFEIAEAGLRLTVHNSPFAAMATFTDRPACGAIAGMLRALGQALWNTPVEVHEGQCLAMSPGLPDESCVFEARPKPPCSPFPSGPTAQISHPQP